MEDTDFPSNNGKIFDSNAELIKQTDRGCAIIGGSIVQERLTTLIVRQLAKKTRETRGLFESDGRIGAFATQIKLAYGLGLVGHDIYCDLGRIKDIRNTFAHDVHLLAHKTASEELITFEHEVIKGWALSLKCPLALIFIPEPKPRERFTVTCCCLRGTLDSINLKFPIEYGPRDRETYNDLPF